MKKIRTLTLATFAAAVAFVSQTSPAWAYEGLSPYNCHVPQHDWPHTLASNLNGIENRSGNPNSRNMIVHCPVPNDSTSLTSGFLTGTDGNNETNTTLGEFRVRGCATTFNAVVFTCSAFQTLRVAPSTVFVGTTDFPLASAVVSAMSGINFGFRYLEVSIPRPGVSGNSRLIGYEVF